MTNAVNPQIQTRRQKAAATRLRIIRGATDLFDQLGYAGTRMTAVAERAGVAVQTVYLVFHTKPELLQACLESAVLGEDGVPPPLRPFFSALRTAPTAAEALRCFATGNGEIVARAARVDATVRGALHEPDVAALLAYNESLRRDGYADVVAAIDERFGLRDGLGRERATDVLLTLAGPQLYRSLVSEYGWPHTEYVAWVAQTAGEALLGLGSRE